MVSAEDHPWLASKLEERGYDVMTMIDDVQPLFDLQKIPSTSASFDYDSYHNLDDVRIHCFSLFFIIIYFFCFDAYYCVLIFKKLYFKGLKLARYAIMATYWRQFWRQQVYML